MNANVSHSLRIQAKFKSLLHPDHRVGGGHICSGQHNVGADFHEIDTDFRLSCYLRVMRPMCKFGIALLLGHQILILVMQWASEYVY